MIIDQEPKSIIGLRKEIKEALIVSEKYIDLVRNTTKLLVNECEKAKNEATIAVRFERALNELLTWYGITFNPVREQEVRTRTIGSFGQKRKRIDSRFMNVITEYKFNIFERDLNTNIKQLTEYIENLSENENKEIDKYFGVLTDGRQIIFVSYNKSEKIITAPLPITESTIIELLKVYLSLERKQLDAEGLVTDFQITSKNNISRSLAIELYKELNNDEDNSLKYDNDWEKIFKLAAHNKNNNKAIKDRKLALAKTFDIDIKELDETKALYALQTSYVIIIKLIAHKVVTQAFFNETNSTFDMLKRLNERELRSRLLVIEKGDLFREIGIRNLLEGDFFSWYLDEKIWNFGIYTSLKDCIDRLSEYDTNQRIFTKKSTSDIFTSLYESMVPKEVRHTLGEYYTPSWLADRVITTSINNVSVEKWRAIDTCSGSGTFVMKCIEKIIQEDYDDKEQYLFEILNRVNAIDINPLAVLTCRINYFIAISGYLSIETLRRHKKIVIPVYLGDSALAPKTSLIDGVEMVEYDIDISGETVEFKLPKEVIKSMDVDTFEKAIMNSDYSSASRLILETVQGYSDEINAHLENFVLNLKLLFQHGYNYTWIRSILSFLKTRTIGKFDIITSNPPWIDWKVLPDGYRSILKKACIDSHIFSGDSYTGGINLNICALIANVSANTWLKKDGVQGILMPKSIAFQSSYKGFRRLTMEDGKKLNYLAFDDWTQAGNPFNPVKEKFFTYYFKLSDKRFNGTIPVTSFIKKSRINIENDEYQQFSEIEGAFEVSRKDAFIACEEFNNFTITNKAELIPDMKRLAGTCAYDGRVGLGLYPKDLLFFELDDTKQMSFYPNYELLMLSRHSSKRTERSYEKIEKVIEPQLIYPVIEGPNIKKFHVDGIKYYSPFPYTEEDLRRPIAYDKLIKRSPLLCEYYYDFRSDLKKTDYNDRIQGKKGDFYSITRVGKYTFAPVRVVFRNNSKFDAAVISDTTVPWGERKMYLLHDHACSIAQKPNGEFIDYDEAHYICAILNSNIVNEFVISSSDSRSFKSKLQIKIDEYDENNLIHKELANLSKEAHEAKKITKEMNDKLDNLICQYINQRQENE